MVEAADNGVLWVGGCDLNAFEKMFLNNVKLTCLNMVV